MRKEFFRSSLFPEKSVERDRIRRLRQVHPWESAREKSAALKRSALLSQAPDAECKKRFVATTVMQKPVHGTFSARLHLSSLKQLSFGLNGCPDSWSSRKNRNNDRFRDEVQAMVIQQRNRTEALMMYLLKSWQVRSIMEGQKKLLLFRWTSCATSSGSWLNMVFTKQGFQSEAATKPQRLQSIKWQQPSRIHLICEHIKRIRAKQYGMLDESHLSKRQDDQRWTNILLNQADTI